MEMPQRSSSRSPRGRIVVAGAIAAHPIGGGGNTWAFLQYVLGFRRLGFEVLYVEEIAPERCVDAEWTPAPLACSYNARYLHTVAERFGFATHFALWSTAAANARVGVPHTEVVAFARTADAVVNLSGRLHDADVLGAVRKRIYVDLDPGFTQIWHAQYGVDMNFAGHDAHFTVGLCLGTPNCHAPTCDIAWQPIVPPVGPPGMAYPLSSRHALHHRGRLAGLQPRGVARTLVWSDKRRVFAHLDLPQRVSVPLELCLAIHPDEPDLRSLQDAGWHIVDPRVHVASPDAYRHYVQHSRGECTVVKNGYRVGHTGWFSDRTACYLAAAHPAIVQDTGFTEVLPTGRGLLCFRSVEEAAACLGEVEAAYAVHAQAAYAWAEAHCCSDRVLRRMLERSRV